MTGYTRVTLPPSAPHLVLRTASPADREAIAQLWHAAWHDAHADIVAPELLPHRGLPHFRALVRGRVHQITMAVIDERLVGFVGVDDDELVLLFVAASARGTGVADLLIEHAHRQIAERYLSVYLLDVEQNALARRFYERHGFQDVGLFPYA